MKEKIVMTEKGFKLHNEILLQSINDELPPFIEDAKAQKSLNIPRRLSQPAGPAGENEGNNTASQPTLRIADLFENSNGYLDRFTLKSAQSNRPNRLVKPFFLPDYTFKEVILNNPQQQQAKYPGIYPPPPKTAGAIPSNQLIRQNFSQKSLQSRTGTSKSHGFMRSNNPFNSTMQSNGNNNTNNIRHPLVLEYDSIGQPPMTAPGSSNRIGRIGGGKNEMDPQNMQQQQQQQRTLRSVGFGISPRDNLFEDSPDKTQGNSLFGTRTIGFSQQQQQQQTGSMWNSGTIMNFNMNATGQMTMAATNGNAKMIAAREKDAYQKSLRNRMDVKKAIYLQEREVQEKKLKELVAQRQNLSKDPVHVAAAYLQQLKQEDEHVDELAYDVTFQKKRYKERLQEYHHHKYEKSWGKLAFPAATNRKKLPKIVKSGGTTGSNNNNNNNFDDLDEDTLDNPPTNTNQNAQSSTTQPV